MLKAAVRRGWLDEKRAVLEALTSIARAGADLTITYYAKDAARWIRDTSHSIRSARFGTPGAVGRLLNYESSSGATAAV